MPLLVGLGGPVHECDLEGQDADQHIDQSAAARPTRSVRSIHLLSAA